MAIITTGSHPKSLWPGVYKHWGMKYNQFPVEFTQLFDEKTSKKNYEELVQNTGLGLAPIKTQGAGIAYDSTAQGYVTRSTHVVYGLGYIVTREEMDDNLYAEVSNARSGSLAFAMRQTKENVAANVYNRAFNSAYTFGDGVELISDVHPNTNGGTWSNELSTAAALSEVAVEDLIIQIKGALDDRGLRISLMPRCLNIPRQLEFEANRILKSTLQSNSADHNINVLRAINSIPEGIKINHYFTDANNWFIRTSIVDAGMCCFNRRAVEFTKDNDFNTENALAKATERYSFTVGDPRAIYGSAPA